MSVSALTQVAGIARAREDFHKVCCICTLVLQFLIPLPRLSTTTSEFSIFHRRMAKSGDHWVIVT